MKLTIRSDKPIVNLYNNFPKDLREHLEKWDLGTESTFYESFYVDLDMNQHDEALVNAESKELLLKRALANSDQIKELANEYLNRLKERFICCGALHQLDTVQDVSPMNIKLADMTLIQREFLTNESWLYLKSLNTRKCLDEQIDSEMYVSDEYRKAMAYMLWAEGCTYYNEDTFIENCNFQQYGLVEDSWTNICARELLLHIHARLVIGGKFGQYEDNLVPYFNNTKLLYKNIVSVQKVSSVDSNQSSQGFSIASKAYKCLVTNDLVDKSYFLLIVHPIDKKVTIMLHVE